MKNLLIISKPRWGGKVNLKNQYGVELEYDRKLSPDEIESLRENPYQLFDPPPVQEVR